MTSSYTSYWTMCQGSVMWSFGVFFVNTWNKLLNKKSSCWWCGTSWHSRHCNVSGDSVKRPFKSGKMFSYFCIWATGGFWTFILPGADSIWRCRLISIGIPIVEIRRPYDHLISTMGIPIPGRWHLYIESGPRTVWHVLPPCWLNGITLYHTVRCRCRLLCCFSHLKGLQRNNKFVQEMKYSMKYNFPVVSGNYWKYISFSGRPLSE